jgi:uncharacterized membrane protein
MNTWFPVVRIVHILCGMVALFVAPVAMIAAKGGPAHIRWGKVYFWMMAVVASTAMVMAIYRPIIFLALIAIFSFYFSFRGYRQVVRKRQGPQAIDWFAALTALLGSMGLLALGIHPLATVALPAPVVSIAFGLLGILVAGMDLKDFLRPPQDRNAWWYGHMGGMLGSYIATVSAFSAVNFHFLPTAVRWLWPSIIGVPGIFIWIGYYRRKFTRQPKPTPPAQTAMAGPV